MTRHARAAGRLDRGFSLIELVIALAVLALILGIAVPAYLGDLGRGVKPGETVVTTRNNKAAVDEAASMADAWRTTAYSCYVQNNDASKCASNEAIGFTQPAGKYWNWTSQAQQGVGGATYAVIDAAGGTAITVSWPSNNAGLENGETYLVSLFISGTSRGQVAATCLPISC